MKGAWEWRGTFDRHHQSFSNVVAPSDHPGSLEEPNAHISKKTQYFCVAWGGIQESQYLWQLTTEPNVDWRETRAVYKALLISTYVRFVGISPICLYWFSRAGCASGSEFLMSQQSYQTPLYSLLSKLWEITIVLKMIRNAHKWKPCTQVVRFSKFLLITKGNYKTQLQYNIS